MIYVKQDYLLASIIELVFAILLPFIIELVFAILLSLANWFAFSALILAFAAIWLALTAVILALDATFVVRLPFALFAVLTTLALFPAVSQAIAIVPTTNIAERAKVFFIELLSLLPFSKIITVFKAIVF